MIEIQKNRRKPELVALPYSDALRQEGESQRSRRKSFERVGLGPPFLATHPATKDDSSETTYMSNVYIDESGTLAEHKVMTVGLVLLDGRRSADRITERILKDLYPDIGNMPRVMAQKKLHFVDMSTTIQSRIASHLAGEQIQGIVNSHWHTGAEENHEIVFGRYTKMVQLLIYRALEQTLGPPSVTIAQQGGFETYEKAFLADLFKVVESFHKREKIYRSVDFTLKSAQTNRGLQLADFYAGSVRKMLLDSLEGLTSDSSSPYSQIQHQIRLDDYIDFN
ncbi:MAG: DUF3800 domain-containing protein [Candidatus Melainabacteria bacterium]|nr:DUF3800 domain-containing protein [Candidatus Melainabacteria bacterium]